ncbi:MAG TPA: hypothetical protein P5340_11675, partial [Defluviicoccus sp.]|nr:hypothetical protein [Defluviicoccus sp.]
AAARPLPGALADDPIAVAKALHHEGVHAVRDVALIEWADELIGQAKLPRARTEAWCRVLDTIDNWREVTFPLKGRDAIALGVPHGRSIGRLLRGVEDWWEEGGYVASRADCLEKLKAVLEEESR